MKELRRARLAFTLTPGRSGTTLLARILSQACAVQCEHEAAPRLNFVMRSALTHPLAARWWLTAEKLPAIKARMSGDLYVEASHLYAKGFVEPLLELGFRPLFIVLDRDLREVALSNHAINCIPERTADGRLVLLSPTDPGVLRLDNWASLSDYQLCYWYVMEMRRRMDHYAQTLPDRGCKVFRISMPELLEEARISELLTFLGGKERLDPVAFASVTAMNQNPQSRFNKGSLRPPPNDLDHLENEIEQAVASGKLTPALQ